MRTFPAEGIALPEPLRPESQPFSPVEAEVSALFLEFRNPLLRYLRSMGLSVDDGEEITQEVFIALFLHLKSGKPRDNLRGWIFRVGHNQALKLRTRSRCTGGEAAAHRDPKMNPEEEASSNQRHRRVAAVMSALPQLDGECLALRAEGLRYREIAEVLTISLGAVSNAMARSLAKISRATEGV